MLGVIRMPCTLPPCSKLGRVAEMMLERNAPMRRTAFQTFAAAALSLGLLALPAGAQTPEPSHPGGGVSARAAGPSLSAEEAVLLLEGRIAEARSEGPRTRAAVPQRPEAAAEGRALAERAGDPILNLNTGMTYTDLQTAVDEAGSGNTLRIQSSFSAGIVDIDKDLTIEGASGNATETISASADTGTSGDARGWIRVAMDVDLVVRDLSFSGTGQLIFQAIRHQGTGLFENVHFSDIQYNASGPTYAGIAIAAYGGPVDVRDCSFQDIGRIGTFYFGAGVTGSLYEGNSFVGKGDGNFLDYGLELGGGAQVAAWNNVHTDCRGVAASDGSGSAGVLASTFFGPGTMLLARENTVLDSSVGIYVGYNDTDSTAASVRFNRIASNADGLVSTSTVEVDAERNWWGCNDGPGSTGCDSTVAVYMTASIDADPWLVLGLTPGSDRVIIEHSTSLTADLTMDSDGADASVEGTLADGIPVLFGGGTLGTVDPSVTGLTSGTADATFTAGSTPGLTQVSATVDNETVEEPIEVLDRFLFADGFETGDTSAWSATQAN